MWPNLKITKNCIPDFQNTLNGLTFMLKLMATSVMNGILCIIQMFCSSLNIYFWISDIWL